jgi:hypothetical protein
MSSSVSVSGIPRPRHLGRDAGLRPGRHRDVILHHLATDRVDHGAADAELREPGTCGRGQGRPSRFAEADAAVAVEVFVGIRATRE